VGAETFESTASVRAGDVPDPLVRMRARATVTSPIVIVPMSVRLPPHASTLSGSRRTIHLHAALVAERIAVLLGPSRTAAVADSGTAVARSLVNTDHDGGSLDPSQPWRGGTVPVVEVSAAGLPEWTLGCPRGADLLIVAELDPEAGSVPVRRFGPITADALAAQIDTMAAGVAEAIVVPGPARAPTVVVHLVGGRGGGFDPASSSDRVLAAESTRLAALRGEVERVVSVDGPAADAEVDRALRDRACASGWYDYIRRAPSRSALTMRALRRSRPRPIALRRVPGQVARGVVRRGRKDRLVAEPELPPAIVELRDARRSGASPVATVTVIALAGPADDHRDLRHEVAAVDPPISEVVVLAARGDEDDEWDLAPALASVTTDFVAVRSPGVRLGRGAWTELLDVLVDTSARVVGAPVAQQHLTELGVDLHRTGSLPVGYFAPLADGVVVMAAADAVSFEPAAPDRPLARLFDAARASGIATFVTPDVAVARDLGVMSDETVDEYLAAFGHLDEIVDPDSDQTAPVELDPRVERLVETREALRSWCDRLAAGSPAEVDRLRVVLPEDLVDTLAPDWVGDATRTRLAPDSLRMPSALERRLAAFFGESPRLRDE
jgi:hypothetical protein